MPRRRTLIAAKPRGPRRKLVWCTSATNSATLTAGTLAAKADLLSQLEVAGVSSVGVTIMRTHSVLAILDSNNETNPQCQFGWIVEDLNANPDPTGDTGADWLMLRVMFPCTGGGVLSSSITASQQMIYGKEFDIRSKRRVEELGERYFFALRNTGNQTFTYTTFHRTLVALP